MTPSKLAQLVIAYRERFGRHVPEAALRLPAGDLAAVLQNSLVTDVPLSEEGWGRAVPTGFSPREFRSGGCILRDEESAPTKGPDGEWLQ